MLVIDHQVAKSHQVVDIVRKNRQVMVRQRRVRLVVRANQANRNINRNLWVLRVTSDPEVPPLAEVALQSEVLDQSKVDLFPVHQHHHCHPHQVASLPRTSHILDQIRAQPKEVMVVVRQVVQGRDQPMPRLDTRPSPHMVQNRVRSLIVQVRDQPIRLRLVFPVHQVAGTLPEKAEVPSLADQLSVILVVHIRRVDLERFLEG